METAPSGNAAPPPPAREPFDAPLTRWEQTFVTGLKGTIGGALAGSLGGGFFDRGDIWSQFVLGAWVGGLIGLIAGILEATTETGWRKLWGLAWFLGSIVGGGLLCSGRRIAGWMFGVAVQEIAAGLLAALIGGLIGMVAGATFGYVFWKPQPVEGTAQQPTS